MSAESRPLVSVVIPAYNSARTLSETLRSVAASTYDNIEIIVVDDGSSDRTASIVEHATETDHRIRLLSAAHGGVSSASNRGLAAASGEFVAFVDSDDVWHPSKLEKQVALACAQPDAALIYTFLRMVDESGMVIEDVPAQRFPRRALCRGICEDLAGVNSTMLVRRSAALDAGGFDEALSSRQDLLLQLRISARHAIAFVPQYLAGYRVRRNSLSSDPSRMLQSWRILRARIRSEFPQVPEFVLRWADARRLVELAEGFAWSRQFGRTSRLIAQAFARDPAWVLLLLAHRSAGYLRNRLSRPPANRRGLQFYSCDPTLPVQPPRRLGQKRLKMLARLEHRRIQRLAELDRQIVPSDG